VCELVEIIHVRFARTRYGKLQVDVMICRRDQMSVVNCRGPFPKPQSGSSLYPDGWTSAKVTVSLGVWNVFFLCPTCHVLAKISRIAFVTSAAWWYYNPKGSHGHNSWGTLKNCILGLRSEIKIEFGRRRFAAAHVQGLWQAGLKVPTTQCRCCSDAVAWA
jgi:hypothetical protein